jgi:hypothetical protein
VNALQQALDAPTFPQFAWCPTPQRNGSFSGLGGTPSFSTTATHGAPPARSEGTLLPSLSDTEALFLAGYKAFEDDINRLKQSYVFTSGRALDLFLASRRAIVSTLSEAIVPLRLAFGEDRLFQLELSVDEYDTPTIYGIAVWRGSVASASQAFEAFSESWWLDHMTPATSDLAFIYRIFR